MKFSEIPQDILKQISVHAEASYPHECCGFILIKEFEGKKLFRARACKNIQDEQHSSDPAAFPRTSRTAYWMDPKDILAMEKEKRTNGEKLAIIYHSHIDAEPVFSKEDERLALYDGRPVYEGVDYLIFGIYEGKTRNAHLFCWQEARKEFAL